MGETKIEWADKVWNPVTGCSKVSQGCKHCYAERMAKRLAGRNGYPPAPDQFKVTLHPEKLDEPFHWKKPARVFVDSMSDLFHPDVPFEFVSQIFWAMINNAQHHTFMILTKRPSRMLEFINSYKLDEYGNWDAEFSCFRWNIWPLPNVWLGISIEDQKTANERIPLLSQMPAAVRFLSCEPLLNRIDLIWGMGKPDDDDWDLVNEIQDANDDQEPEEFVEECEAELDWINYGNDLVVNPEHREWESWRLWRARLAKFERLVNWVIVGGESGPGARPMHIDWVRDIRDQCTRAKVPFFFKGWGEWAPGLVSMNAGPIHEWEDGTVSQMVGRRNSGSLLDGREWKQFPEQG